MAEKKKIGEILKEAGLVDDFQLGAALSHQKNWGGKLGAILVEMGFVREKDVARMIATSLRMPCVDLFEPPISPPVFKLIKPEIAKKHTIIPAKKEGETVLLAMADPMNIHVLDEVRFIIGLPVKPAFAMEHEIKDAIRKYYDGEEVVRTTPAALPVFHSSEAAKPMEIIHGGMFADIQDAKKAVPPKQELSPSDDSLRQEVSNIKLYLESLISLMIEKNIIVRADLIRIIDQKKIGR